MNARSPIAPPRLSGRRLLTLLFALSTLTALATAPFTATFNIVPGASGPTEGSESLSYPFSQNSIHYQQVFTGLPAGTITELSFRADGSYISYGGSAPFFAAPFIPTSIGNVKILLGLTTLGPGALTTNFNGNFVSNTQRAVYADGSNNAIPLLLSSSFTGKVGGPSAFDTRISLTKSYSFSPAAGQNLLVDITITGTANSSVPHFDGVTSSSETSRLYSVSGGAATTDAKGLVTQFTYGTFALPAATPPSSVNWIIFTGNVNGINSEDAAHHGSTGVAAHFFNRQYAFIAGSPTGGTPVPSFCPNAYALGNFTSFNTLQQLVTNDGGTGSGGYRNTINAAYDSQILLYDNEDWTKTPAISGDDEQHNPATYQALFANLAHAFGYAFISAPGGDLVPLQSSDPDYNPAVKRNQNYLNIHFPVWCAGAPADAYDIQAQYSQDYSGTGQLYATPPLYASFVQQAATAAAGANPATVVVCGITTTSGLVQSGGSGATASQSQLETAILSTSGYVSGFWCNIPDQQYTNITSALIDLWQNQGY